MAQMTGKIHCYLCKREWRSNPFLSVACPTCHAPIGSPCKRPSEHSAWEIHEPREWLAWDTTVPHCTGQLAYEFHLFVHGKGTDEAAEEYLRWILAHQAKLEQPAPKKKTTTKTKPAKVTRLKRPQPAVQLALIV